MDLFHFCSSIVKIFSKNIPNLWTLISQQPEKLEYVFICLKGLFLIYVGESINYTGSRVR